MKILSIGNSFSQDAHRWLHALAEKEGVDLQTVNLYIGGCSLERHWNNVVSDEAAYDLEINGGAGVRKIALSEALTLDTFDVVTVQQVSGQSGIPKSYEPYLTNLVALVREKQPQAALYFHQTWAYELDSQHGSFPLYHCDQEEMYRRLSEVIADAAKRIDATIIPVGDAIQTVRRTVPAFDYKNGGLSLNRDDHHLSYDYGRFTAAATWFRTLTGQCVTVKSFEAFDPALVQAIVKVVNEM